MGVVDASYDNPLKVEEKASMPLAGGIANMGYQCGLLWGAALAAGAQAYRLHGANSHAKAEAILATQKLVDVFRTHTKNEINCLEISEMDMQGSMDKRAILKFFLKGGPIGCLRLTARYTRDVRSEIDSSLPLDRIDAPESPVSCSSLLAKRIGVSEMHQVMAAGFAGGIGLSGGGCGVLGAAIWIMAMRQPPEIDGFSYSGTWVTEIIEKFLEISDYEFECSDIIGRQFENVEDHAEFIRAGGCSKIIDGLAA
jgi:hypothetical protein